jgi:signal transduction histidine kinase
MMRAVTARPAPATASDQEQRRSPIAWWRTAWGTHDAIARRSMTLVLLIGASSIATLVLVAVGYQAFDGWQRNARLLAERRADEKATILNVALDRDMKGVQTSVLPRFSGRDLAFATPYDIIDLFASAFARFPYPESFFVWRRESPEGAGHLYSFSRDERPPSWVTTRSKAARYPVAVMIDPPALEPLANEIRRTGDGDRRIFDQLIIGAERYQMIVTRFYDSSPQRALVGVVGFLVNLDWVRREYFGEITRQIESVLGDSDISLAIIDEHGTRVTATGLFAPTATMHDRVFPLAFLDRALLSAQPGAEDRVAYWTARVGAGTEGDGPTRNWRLLLALMALACLTALLSVLLIGRTLKVTAELAVMKSDFVSTVTHDLKTPLALIRLVGDTLGLGRFSSPETIRTYAHLLSTEAAQLTLRIDNLLAYARVTEVKKQYRFESVDLMDVIQESLRRAEPRLRALGFEIDANLTDAPSVRGDRGALLQVLENVIDNAIKYSDTDRLLRIHTAVSDGAAALVIQDRGIGIPRHEISHVFEKFFRGRAVTAAGSGLGLAIARRVIGEHGGTILLESEIRQGTTVTINLPLTQTT